MLKMMLAFVRDMIRYRDAIKKQTKWIDKYAAKNGYAVNPNPMMNTHLKIWLSEMEETFGKRLCPCFEPSGDPKLDRAMICPCKFMDAEIEEYGTCHCSLFGRPGMSKQEWKDSNARLMAEYRVELDLQGDTLDTRGMPLDKHRGLPIPDASHQLKSALLQWKGSQLEVIVATRQEADNLEKIAAAKGYGYACEHRDDAWHVHLKFTKE